MNRIHNRIAPRIFARIFEALVAIPSVMSSGASTVFHAAWEDLVGISQTLLTGTGPVVTDHAEAILAPDHEDVYREFAIDDPVWEGGRVVRNLIEYSEDMEDVYWKKTLGTLTTGVEDPLGGNTAYTWTADSGSARIRRYIDPNPDIDSDIKYIESIWIRRRTGTGLVRLYETQGTAVLVSPTSEWQRFSVQGDGGSTTLTHCQVWLVTAGDAVDIWHPQTENSTGRSDITTPSEYIPTTTAAVQKVFAYANGNTVASEVVTEAEGADLDPAPYLATTGFTDEGVTPATPWTNVYPAVNHSNAEGPYYLEFKNTGDDVDILSAGSDVFLKTTSDQLILDDGTNQISTACAAGKHKAGVAFDADTDKMNLNLNGVWVDRLGGEIIVNGTFDDDSGWTVSDGTWVIADGVLTATNGTNYAVYQSIATIGKVYQVDFDIVEYTSGNVYMRSGTGLGTQRSAVGSYSELITAAALQFYFMGSTTFNGVIDNVSIKEVFGNGSEGTPYDDTLGSGVLTLGETARNLKRWNETDLTKQEDLIDKEMAFDPDAFVMVWRTTTDDESITLPATGTNDFTVDWGDGTIETVTTASPDHTYASPGDYRVILEGTCTTWKQNNAGDKTKLIKVLNLGVMGWTTFASAFYGCSELVEFTAGNTDTSGVTTMSTMMRDWTSMTSPPDLTGFDTSSVTHMGAMMMNWTSMVNPPDLTGFDTSKVTNMYAMMQSCSSMVNPPDLSGFDTSSVTTMLSMMRGCSSMVNPPDLTGFDTSSVTSMSYMMNGWSSMTSPPDLSGFDTSKVTDMSAMMQNWSSMGAIDIDIDLWDIPLVTTMNNMLASTQLTTVCYDRVLAAWSLQTVQSGVPAHFGAASTYNNATEKAVLTDAPNSWVITDGGAA